MFTHETRMLLVALFSFWFVTGPFIHISVYMLWESIHQDIGRTGLKLLCVQMLVQNFMTLSYIVYSVQSLIMAHLLTLIDSKPVHDVILIIVVVWSIVVYFAFWLLIPELIKTEVVLFFLSLKLIIWITVCMWNMWLWYRLPFITWLLLIHLDIIFL